MPLYGHELSASLTPFDAGFGRVVKFEKEGDFVGRAALAEAAARAERTPPRTLVGLVAEGRRVPRAGYAVGGRRRRGDRRGHLRRALPDAGPADR
ncbi:Aminomethyltransferase [Streptomyces hirsutus]